MTFRTIILNICLIISTGCLGTGYILAGYWLILPALLAMVLFWIFTKDQPVFWSASSLLVVIVILAAIGITVDLSLTLMIIACTTALVSWDLIQFNQSMVGNSLRKTNASVEKYRLHSLALAASTGLMLVLISSYINLQFTFGLIVFLVLIAMGCLVGSMQYIMKKNIDSRFGSKIIDKK